MKILEMPPYYLPEQIASTHLTLDLTEGFVNKGYMIENYVPVPCRGISKETRKKYSKMLYEEMYNGKVKIIRFPIWKEGHNPIGRAFRYFVSNIIQARKGCRAKDIDIVIGGSTPPIQGLLCGYVANRLSKQYGKKVPFIYLLQDVFPDSLVTTGLAKKNGILWRIGRLIENAVYKQADKIIVISEGIKNNIMNKGVSTEKITVIKNWIDLDHVKPVEKNENSLIEEFSIPKDKFLVVYAGNFGAAQGAEIILKTAENLKNERDIHFVIFGGGAYFENARKDAYRMQNVSIQGLQPQDKVSEVYSLGNVALITCKPGTGNAGMPSKMWSIMACNTPIIASFDLESDLAEELKKSGAGICVKPGDIDELAKAIKGSYNEWKVGIRKTYNFRDYVYNNASKDVCVNRYIEEICETMECSHVNKGQGQYENIANFCKSA